MEKIAKLQLSDEALDHINSVRAREVTRWLAEEGPEKYFAAIAAELGPLPVLKQEEEEMEEAGEALEEGEDSGGDMARGAVYLMVWAFGLGWFVV